MYKKRKLLKYQRKALHFINQHNGQAGIFLPCGVGKTLIGIRYSMKYLPCLIICRRDDYFTFKDELFLDNTSSDDIFTINHGSDRFKLKPWVLISYGLIKNRRVQRWIRKSNFQSVISDESQKLKRHKSKQTKKTISVTKTIPNRLAMTATPIGNDLIDIFSQALYIDGGKTFGTNEWKFRKKYYIKPEGCPKWIVKRTSKKIIQGKIKNFAFGYLQEHLLNLPPIRHIIKSVGMSSEQKKMYSKLIGEWEYEINGETIELNQIIVRLSKLKQVASGFIYGPDGKPKFLKCTKLDLLKSILKDYLCDKPKIVIWCSFTAEIKQICKLAKAMKITYVHYYGSDRKIKNSARVTFRDNKKIRLFIAQVDSGVGMNELICADTAIYFSNSFKVLSRIQSKGRIRRKGSHIHKCITYWDLLTEGTVDIAILKKVKKSISIAEFVLSEIRKGHNIHSILTPPT